MHCNAEKIGLERKRVKLLLDGQPNTLDYSILNIIQELGCIHLLNTRKYCENTRKYCGNTYEY